MTINVHINVLHHVIDVQVARHMSNTINVALKHETHKRLTARCRKDQSYDDCISALLDAVERIEAAT